MLAQLISQWQIRLRLLQSWLRFRWTSKHRPIDQIRARWAQEGTKERWLTTKLFDLTRHASTDAVDDATWMDLEFDRLFSMVDSTLTMLGSQCLYRKMRIYRNEPGELQKDYAAYQALRRDSALREKLQLCLWVLRSDSEALTCESVFGKVPPSSRSVGLVLSMSVASLIGLVITILNPTMWWIFGVIVIGNALIVSFLRSNIHETFLVTGRIGRMISAAARLERVGANHAISQPARLSAVFREDRDFRGLFRWFLVDRSNDLIASLFFWLNLLFLVDHVAAAFVARKLRRHRDRLARVFLEVGSIDADIAIASWLERIPAHCQPEIVRGQIIEFVEAFHPLLTDPVCNSLTLNGQSALVVGTNMAGKTTFIKMVGVNIILSRTIGVCFAVKAVLPESEVMASIRAEHSVSSGRSHFFSELERILLFMQKAGHEGRGVFLIDELFCGTNTPERVASAKAVLETIGAHAQVLVTTHDVELQHMLEPKFQTFHFVENPDLPEVFDYRLREGICNSKNAIKLLERIGFPPAVVLEARRLADIFIGR